MHTCALVASAPRCANRSTLLTQTREVVVLGAHERVMVSCILLSFFSRMCITRVILSKRGVVQDSNRPKKQKTLSSYKLQPIDQPSSTPLLNSQDNDQTKAIGEQEPLRNTPSFRCNQRFHATKAATESNAFLRLFVTTLRTRSHHELKQSSADGESCAQPNFMKNLNQTSLE
jgi:hypothetical protein